MNSNIVGFFEERESVNDVNMIISVAMARDSLCSVKIRSGVGRELGK
jgi:hypothetical protein